MYQKGSNKTDPKEKIIGNAVMKHKLNKQWVKIGINSRIRFSPDVPQSCQNSLKEPKVIFIT